MVTMRRARKIVVRVSGSSLAMSETYIDASRGRVGG